MCFVRTDIAVARVMSDALRSVRWPIQGAQIGDPVSHAHATTAQAQQFACTQLLRYCSSQRAAAVEQPLESMAAVRSHPSGLVQCMLILATSLLLSPAVTASPTQQQQEQPAEGNQRPAQRLPDCADAQVAASQRDLSASADIVVTGITLAAGPGAGACTRCWDHPVGWALSARLLHVV